MNTYLFLSDHAEIEIRIEAESEDAARRILRARLTDANILFNMNLPEEIAFNLVAAY